MRLRQIERRLRPVGSDLYRTSCTTPTIGARMRGIESGKPNANGVVSGLRVAEEAAHERPIDDHQPASCSLRSSSVKSRPASSRMPIGLKEARRDGAARGAPAVSFGSGASPCTLDAGGAVVIGAQRERCGGADERDAGHARARARARRRTRPAPCRGLLNGRPDFTSTTSRPAAPRTRDRPRASRAKLCTSQPAPATQRDRERDLRHDQRRHRPRGAAVQACRPGRSRSAAPGCPCLSSRHAGAAPIASALKSRTPSANSSTRPSNGTPSSRGSFDAPRTSSSRTAAYASAEAARRRPRRREHQRFGQQLADERAAAGAERGAHGDLARRVPRRAPAAGSSRSRTPAAGAARSRPGRSGAWSRGRRRSTPAAAA